MDAKKLSSMEIDAIGEILNISLGASSTAISTMLDARVDITTPVVQVRTREEFEFGNLEPAIGVEITYIEGLTGSNIMVLKKNDVRIIVGMLMGMEVPEEDFVLDEMSVSAICEVMNQMMGASATALSELLSRTVNISTPVSFEIESPESFKDKYFTEENQMVVIGFTLRIADKVESEFMNLMPIALASELVSGFFTDGVPDLEEPAAVEETPVQSAQPEPQQTANVQPQPDMPVMESAAPQPEMPVPQNAAPQPEMPVSGNAGVRPEMPVQMNAGVQPDMTVPQNAAPQQAAYQAGMPVQGTAPVPQSGMEGTPPVYPAGMPQMAYAPVGVPDMQVLNSMTQMMEMMRQQLEMQQAQMNKMQSSEPRKIKVDAAPRPNLEGKEQSPEVQEANLDLIMGVPLEVSVEIGRTKKLVKDILELNKGSLVVLDKLAGEQVDLFVNGQCIAQGDVVVVDDNFGIRITEILADEIRLAE